MITSKQAKEYRLKLGLSQNFISKATGLSRPYLSNFEAGKFDPDLEFKETLEAFFIKQGIKIDDKEQDNPKSKDTPKESGETSAIAENQNINMDNKVINGIVVNTNTISYAQAQSYMEEIDFLNSDLLMINDNDLPTKHGYWRWSDDIIDGEKVKDLAINSIFKMAKAYLQIMDIRGEAVLSLEPEQDLPEINELTIKDNYTVGDYITHFLEVGWSDDEESNKGGTIIG